MCNDYGNHIPYSDYLAAFSQVRIPASQRHVEMAEVAVPQ
jgi:hypothetical protein